MPEVLNDEVPTPVEILEDELLDASEKEEEKVEEEAPRLYPAAISEFLSRIIPHENVTTIIGAGDGSLFDSERFLPDYCLGMEENDKLSRKRKATYTPLVGEFEKALTLLEPLEHTFGHTIIDLTRGLSQSIVAEVQARQSSYGYLTVVVQPDNQTPLITEGLVATLRLPELELSFRFLLRPEDRKNLDPIERSATLDTLDLLGPWVREHLDKSVSRSYRGITDEHGRYDRQPIENWRIVHKEYGRRFIRDAKARAFDLTLVGGKLINTHIGGWATRILQIEDHYANINGLHNKSVNTFAQDPGTFDLLIELVEREILILDPRLVEIASAIVHEARFTTSPLYDLPIPMRTAFVREKTSLTCIKTDKKRGFERGKTYKFRAFEPNPIERHFFKYVEDRKTGDVVLREHKRQIRYLSIRIEGEVFNDIDTEDLKYLIRHFRLPNPGSLATRYPEKVEEALGLVEQVEEKYLTPRGLALRGFQRRDVAMHLAKGSGILAWEQGLGKTLGGLVFILASFLKPGTQQAALIITPQDLILQWQDEAKRFLGFDLEQIGGTSKTQKQADGTTKAIGPYVDIVNAQKLAKRLENPDEGGLFITYYEALSQTGAALRQKEEPFVVATVTKTRYVPGEWQTVDDGFGGSTRKWVDGHNEEYQDELWSKEYCPRCHNRWDGSFCKHRERRELPNGDTERGEICGYSVYGRKDADEGSGRAPTIAHLLAGAFKRGVIVVDEGTMIGGSANGGDSQRSLAVRGLTGRYRLLMSGTPIKNFIAQAFWLLWWTLGNDNPRFEYRYLSGRAKFTDRFTVFQWVKNDEGMWGPKKAVGEVTNLSRLWRQLSSSLTRRTQDNCGEDVQPVKYHVIETPLGVNQREQIEYFRLNSGDLFVEKGLQLDPPERRSRQGLGALGFLDTKWNYACVMPQADPDWEWTHVNVSNWTPMLLKTLETTMALVKQGRKVLLGTDLVHSVSVLTDALRMKGIDAFALIDSSGKTIEPKKRSQLIRDFKTGSAQVLVSTASAIRMGHSLEAASAVVVHGLQWDYETFYQYALRVRRLNSGRPIDVFVTLPGKRTHTIVGRKWDSLEDKSRGIGKALDGVLTEREEDAPDIAEILRELREKGVPIVGNEVEERQVFLTWENTPHIGSFEIPEDFLARLAADHEEELHRGEQCPDCDRPIFGHGYWGDIPLCDEMALLIKETADDEWFHTEERLSWELLANEYRLNSESGNVPEYIVNKLIEFDGPSKEELRAAEAVGDFFRSGFTLMAATAVGDFLQALAPTEAAPVMESPIQVVPEPNQPVVQTHSPDTHSAALKAIREELLQYKELHDAGVLTDEEFSAVKAALIEDLKGVVKPATPAAPVVAKQLSLIAEGA